MSIWKEIKKSINSDLGVPLNEQEAFPQKLTESENVLMRISNPVIMSDSVQKVSNRDIKFLIDGKVNISLRYNVGTYAGVGSTSSSRQGWFYIKINDNIVHEFPLMTRAEFNTQHTAIVQTININKNDVLSCYAVVNESARNKSIDYIELCADNVYLDLMQVS